MMDILAEKLGMDTAELKLKNAIRTGDVTVHGSPINSCGLSECIQKTAESAGWKEKRANKKFGRGIGMASMVHESDSRQTDGFAGTVAFVRILEDGRINVMTGEAEYGQGGDTAYAMVAAEELGVPLDHVEVTPVDTDISPYGLGPWGSKLLITASSATRKAALDAKRQLFEIASKMLEAKVEDLEIGDQKISVIGSPERAVSIVAVAMASTYGRGGSAIIGKGIDERDTVNWRRIPGHYGRGVSAYYFDTVVAEVEVNTETGEVKVLKLTLADDCGKAINLLSLEGQIQGATAQGIGNTFLEERICHQGRMLNSSFNSYQLPTALDMPSLETIIVESNEPGGAYGAKGGGENPGIDSTAPAIANAIYNAIGVRIKDLPITPEKILNALEKRKEA
jgi:CO/xanthine dehydrogenase Mo-binding subunit